MANGSERRPIQNYVYPPVANGIPRFPVREILAEHAELIERIRNLSEDKEVFDERWRPVIDRYANLVYLLPASEFHHHRGAGGLLCHGLETSRYVLQQSYDRLHGMQLPPSQRQDARERWLFAGFIAGLTHDSGKTAEMIVTSAGGATWDPFTTPLAEWFHCLPPQDDRLFISWRRGGQDHRRKALNLMHHILLPDDLTYLHEIEPFLLDQIYEAILGEKAPRNDLVGMVQEADIKSLRQDLKRSNVLADLGPEIRQPLARHLVMTINRLIKEAQAPEVKDLINNMREAKKAGLSVKEFCTIHGIDEKDIDRWRRWRSNKPGSVLWVIGSEVYLVWPEMVDDVTNMLYRDATPGIPTNPYLLAEIFEDHGLLTMAPNGNRLWRIKPSVIDAGEDGLLALRLKDPRYVMELIPPAISGQVRAEGDEMPFDVDSPPPSEKPEDPGQKGLKDQEGVSGEPPPPGSLKKQPGKSPGAPAPVPPGIPSPEPPAAPDLRTLEELQEYFASAGPGGRALLQFAGEIARGARCEGQDYKSAPQLALSWGDTKFTNATANDLPEIIESLARAEWLVLNGTSRVHIEPGFGKCMKLKEGETLLFWRLVWVLGEAKSPEAEASAGPAAAGAPVPAPAEEVQTPFHEEPDPPEEVPRDILSLAAKDEEVPDWVIEVTALLENNGPLEYKWVTEIVENRTACKLGVYKLVASYFVIEDEGGKMIVTRRNP
ncbi:MAG: TraI domain-containing protein [Thermodesulfobacteriota bacterium]